MAVIHRRSAVALLAAVSAVVVIDTQAQLAAGATWVVPASLSDSWFDAAAWTPNPPTTSDTVYITNGGAPTLDYGAASISTLYLGSSFGLSGGLILSGTGQLSLASTGYIGYSGSGWVQQNGGTLLAGQLQFGGTGHTSGTYTLNDGSLLVGSSEYLGYGLGASA
ncbi:MAG TPA: hypothetical protein VFE58_10415 [Tepidisphaeraceae bacterium]|jgi:hypothetical protein|nr:hypothetical protein [Tepidisphaeraceae bacterium]